VKLTEKTVALLGYGRANRAVRAYLAPFGCRFAVYTEQPPDDATTAELAAAGVPVRVGAFPAVFREQVLARSPGIRPDLPAIAASVRMGAVLLEESGLLLEGAPVPVIGITGSDGKTTTAALSAALLSGAGVRTFLGGNNGVPLLPRVGEMQLGDVAVAELSSFQLMTAPRAPQVAVITNVTPNHLNWHVDMAEYVAAKCRIFDGNTRLILNAENETTRRIGEARLAAGTTGKTVFFSVEEAAVAAYPDAAFLRTGVLILREQGREVTFDCLGSFRLPGRHNLSNLLAAVAATHPFTKGQGLSALAAFGGVPHRLQRVAEVGGVTYINSSIDTSPTRTAAALSALGGRPICIVGGRGKGISLAPLGDTLAARAKAVFLYGEAAEEIEATLGGRVPARRFGRFAEAFAAAAAAAKAGDTVLLSPGCTAFGEFRDFEARGECFCRLVRELGARRAQLCSPPASDVASQ